VKLLHDLAAGFPGKLIVASFGEDPTEGAKLAPRVEHFQIGDVDAMTAACVRLSGERHRNVYVPLAVFRSDLPPGKKGEEADVAAVLGAVGDFDDADAARWAERLPLPANYAIESSAGRFQTFHFYDRPLPPKPAKAIATRLKSFVKCDHGTSDVCHVWRVPGTLNWPNAKKLREGRAAAPQSVKVATEWDGALTSIDELNAAIGSGDNGTAASSATFNGSSVDVDALPVSKRIKDLIRGVNHPDYNYPTRSESFFAVVCEMVRRGCDDQTIAAVILDPALSVSAHVLDQAKPIEYAQKQIDNARAKVKVDPAAAAPKRELKIVPFRELLEPDLTRRALVKDILSRDAIALMIGPAGCGKTFLALDIALHVAAGRAWFAKRVEAGRVVYVAAEAGASIRNRVAAWARARLSESEESVSFEAVVSPVDLCHAEVGDVDALVAAIGEADLVIIDTVSRALAGGNENGPDDMGAFVAAMDAIRAKLGCAILAVHHIGKDATRGGRGHSLLHCAVDTEIEVEKRDDVSVATLTKQRDGPSGIEIAFKIKQVDLGEDEHGEAVTSCVVDASDYVPPKKEEEKKLPVDAERAQAALSKAIEDGKGEPRDDDGTTVYAVPVATWQAYFRGVYEWASDDHFKVAFGRGRKALMERKIVAQGLRQGERGGNVVVAWFPGVPL
jgi:hypothetical protein